MCSKRFLIKLIKNVFIYGILFLSSIWSYRLLLPYTVFGKDAVSYKVINTLFPNLGLINPAIRQRYYISLHNIIYLLLFPFSPSIVTIDIIYYILISFIAGISMMVYSRNIFTDLRFRGNMVDFASLLSGLFYMSNPFFFTGDLFWSPEVVTYAIFPFILLSLHKTLVSNKKAEQAGYLALFSLLFSYGLLEDSSHILSYGTTALIVQIMLTRIINSKVNVFKSLIITFVGAAWSALIDFPNIVNLSGTFIVGKTSFIYSGPVNPLLHGAFINAFSPIWLLADNLWFNRGIIFYNLGEPTFWIAGSVFIPSLVLSVTLIILMRKLKTDKFALFLVSILLIVFIFYSNKTIIWYLDYHLTSSLGQIYIESYIPEFLITFVYSLLPEYALLNYFENLKSEIMKPAIKFQTSTKFIKKYLILLLDYIKDFQKVLIILFLMLLMALPVFINFPSYVYGSSPFNGFGYAVQFSLNQSNSLLKATTLMQKDNYSADVFWMPFPPIIGVFGYLAPISYSYPLGSDGPFSTQLFSYLVGNHPASLINQENSTYALAYISSLIGVKYFVLYGNALSKNSYFNNSKYFTLAFGNRWVKVYKNLLYNGLVHISPNAVLVSGGLRTYTLFLPFEQYIYESLIVMQDSKYMYFPYLYISKAKGWQGGNVADAGGYPWNGFAGSMINYSWQSTYTVNDGVIYTFSNGSKIVFYVNVTPGLNIVMIRLFTIPSSSTSFIINIDNSTFKVNLPPSQYPRFVWIYLGTVYAKHSYVPVEIKSAGYTTINAILIEPVSAYQKANYVAKDLLLRKNIFIVLNSNLEINETLKEYYSITGRMPASFIVLANNSGSKLLIIKNAPYFYNNVKYYVKYNYALTSLGPLITRIYVRLPYNYNGSLYIVTAGEGPFGIVDGSYAQINDSNEFLSPIPAINGAEGFAIARCNSSKINLVMHWYSTYNLYLSNLIGYVALITSLLVVMFTFLPYFILKFHSCIYNIEKCRKLIDKGRRHQRCS